MKICPRCGCSHDNFGSICEECVDSYQIGDGVEWDYPEYE